MMFSRSIRRFVGGFAAVIAAAWCTAGTAAGAEPTGAEPARTDASKPEAPRAGGPKDRLISEEFLAKSARMVAERMPKVHLERKPIDDAMATNALSQYLTALDFDHTVFLQPDVDEFMKEVSSLDDRLQEGDLSLAYKIFDRYKERLHNRIEFVGTCLKDGFQLDGNEKYDWKRKDAPWPKNQADWDDLWRRKVKNDYIGRLVSRELAKIDEEEKKKKAAEEKDKSGSGGPAASTNKTESASSSAAERDAKLTPEEFITKRYKQLLNLIDESDRLWVAERYLNAFTQCFDPHSNYMSPEMEEDFDINMRLSLFGIGALLTAEDGGIKVERLIPGGPADKDGRLKPGDVIVAVAEGDGDPVDVMHWPLYKAVRIIRGEKGRKVVLTVWPASDTSGGTEKKIDIVRDEVKLEERAAKADVVEIPGEKGRTNRIGVLTLPDFYADFKGGENGRSSARDVRRLVEELKGKNIDGLIFDLRNNGGGSLQDAIEIGGLFIRGGPVVQVKDRLWVRALRDPDSEVVYEGPMVAMVNRMSASASEIVAGMLQDYGRALIVGDSKTHGKGTVQSVVPLESEDERDGALKVTTAKFYRVSGGSTQLKGVASDIVIPSVYDSMEMGEEYLPHAMEWSSVNGARYEALENQWPPIGDLRDKSEARRSKDPQFKAREELLQKVADRVNDKTISLNLKKRMSQVKAERELDRIQREMEEEETEPGKEKDPKKDILLMESARILGDIIQWRSSSNGSAAR